MREIVSSILIGSIFYNDFDFRNELLESFKEMRRFEQDRRKKVKVRI